MILHSGRRHGLLAAALWLGSIHSTFAEQPRSVKPIRPVSIVMLDGQQEAPAAARRSPEEPAVRPTVRKAKVLLSFLDEQGQPEAGEPAAHERGRIFPASHAEPAGEHQTVVATGPELTAPVAMHREDAFADPFGDRGATAPPPPRLREPQQLRLETRLEGATPILSTQQPQAPGSEEIARNCMTDAKNCQIFRDHMRSRSIEQISLDISPNFNPPTSEWAESRPQSPAPTGERREWRNSQNQVVATGTLAGYENGRVLVRDDRGAIQRLPYRELSDEDLCYFANLWRIPTVCTLGQEEFAGRAATPSTFTWKASAVCHKPLYFEETQLERYGHTTGPVLQPVLSGAHFFANIAVLPYRMGINPPTECRYPLGYYRPGSCAPWLVPPVPLSVRGGLMQAGAVVGGVYIIP